MTEEIKISVIIPVYNVQDYIQKTLDSVQKQTKKIFEIIIIDDGSADKTLEIVAKYPVTLYQQKNQGPAAARNFGVSQAKGNWIAFLDGDDIWEPNKIESVLSEIQNNPDVELISTNLVRGNEVEGWIPIDFYSKYDFQHPFLSQIFRRNFIATSTVVVKKICFDKVSGFNPTLRIAEDLDLWIRLAVSGVKFRIINKNLTRYRARKDSTTVNLLKTLGLTKNVLFTNKKRVNLGLFVLTILAWDATFWRLCLKSKNYQSLVKLTFLGLAEFIYLPFFYFF
jgi:glycosyltransferase involved in cell wall biosynthesis